VLSATERRARVADTVGYLRALWSGAANYDSTHYRLDGARAVHVPHPLPPIVLGANGPKMAALAGEVADGVNVHDWQDDLAGVVAIARDRAAARDALGAFEASVECRFDPEWWDRGSAQYARMAVAGVVLRWSPAVGLGAFDAAARHLAR
jgi:alkanesulfonate monooxygenase SsuD/methylene tetrahydromethanopterin reductase-like flavin-dependent oxidoreductase (luciferase family)